ncbi:flagellar hook-associated protein FlgL [Halomonas sp. HL-93]|uniref:flagellar hook-associated protein FlgL n=1 Tax=Halomonas sp. HL-93 TaxID=1666906 RepID=UPI0007F17BB0|nr:flagellar hook-associated protein FlgL [Halomonas sp. HL-93]SBR52374.1 flagellar hook-associated protein 3 FlgL [Halomonas sp. HL-93]
MRISSVTMFDQSTASMNRQQSDFLKVSQQIASGRRVVNPSDDPQAASRAVGVDQAKAITEQYGDARTSARNSLAQTESILNSTSDAITSAKTLLVQASSDTLSDVDRESIASELKGVYETMLGQANATDGNGRYLFGGYNDGNPPFVKQGDAVEYQGDQNTREQRVDSSRLMPVTENGASIFQSVPNSAGYVAEANSDNAGNVTFGGPHVADVNNDGYGDSYRIQFDEDGVGDPTYSIETFDEDSDSWVAYDPDNDGAFTDAAYTSGESVSFGGINVDLKGEPEVGDQIQVAQSGSAQREPNLFRTMEEAIRVLEKPAETESDKADLSNTLKTSMRDLDNSLDNVLTVRASAGARLNELDVIDAVGDNRSLNYEQTLSDLVDLDYNEAISEYSLRQIGLQASQKAFVDVKGMSLFDYL